jgi:hypothetical protein
MLSTYKNSEEKEKVYRALIILAFISSYYPGTTFSNVSSS